MAHHRARPLGLARPVACGYRVHTAVQSGITRSPRVATTRRATSKGIQCSSSGWGTRALRLLHREEVVSDKMFASQYVLVTGGCAGHRAYCGTGIR